MRAVLPAVLLIVLQQDGAGKAALRDRRSATHRSSSMARCISSTGGTAVSAGTTSATGIDFNYGGLPNLQLTAVTTREFDESDGRGLGPWRGQYPARRGVSLRARRRGIRDGTSRRSRGCSLGGRPRRRWATATPRCYCRCMPRRTGGGGRTFGGGGCVVNHGGDAINFCTVGWVVARKVAEHLQLGAEVYYQGAAARGRKATTGVGAGLTYDLSEHFHLMGSIGPGLQNAAASSTLYTWYAALLVTY